MIMETALTILWVGAWVVGGILVIAASLLRCPKCGGWHTSKEEQENCHED